MTRTTHTDGDWKVVLNKLSQEPMPESIDYSGGLSMGTICHFLPPSCDNHREHRLADARLMAASKKLLSACELFDEIFDQDLCNTLEAIKGDKYMVWLAGLLREAEAAVTLAKNGGER